MGNCSCIVHYYKADNDANFANNISDISYKEILSHSTNQKLKNNNEQKIITIRQDMKANIEKKLSEFSCILNISDFEKLVNENIINYIKTHKLNYQEYLPSNLNTYKTNPIEFSNGNVYSGNWNLNGEIEGYGIYLIKNKNVITEGIWLKGNIIYGRIFFPNGDIYEGDIKNSVPHGNGMIIFKNEEIYKGDFENGEMTGKGTFIYSDKSYYSGKIKNGVFEGKGSIKWNNGTEYHGNFVNSVLSGKGKMYNNNTGEKYVGYFDKNEFHGEGVYTYRNGDIYEGNFEYGNRKGRGKYKRNDKVEFDCIWVDDLPNGNGEVIYNNHKIKGFWRNGIIIRQKGISNGNMEFVNDIDINIKPCKGSLCPNSLPHLAINDIVTSQYINGTEEMN